jgi:hypothetical protein
MLELDTKIKKLANDLETCKSPYWSSVLRSRLEWTIDLYRINANIYAELSEYTFNKSH